MDIIENKKVKLEINNCQISGLHCTLLSPPAASVSFITPVPVPAVVSPVVSPVLPPLPPVVSVSAVTPIVPLALPAHVVHVVVVVSTAAVHVLIVISVTVWSLTILLSISPSSPHLGLLLLASILSSELHTTHWCSGRPHVASIPASSVPVSASFPSIEAAVMAGVVVARGAHATTHTKPSVLILQSDGLSEQLGPVEEVEGVLSALLVLEHDEGEVLLLLGFPVPGDGDPLQGPGSQEQLVEDLLIHLL